MGLPAVHLTLVADSRVARDLVAGGVFVHGCEVALHEHCELVISAVERELRLEARAVYVDGNGGAGFELVGFDDALRTRLIELLEALAARAEAAAQPHMNDALDTLDLEPFDLGARTRTLDYEPERTSAPAPEPLPPLELELELELQPEPLAVAPAAAESAPEPGGDAGPAGETEEERVVRKNLHERLRGLTMAEAVKKASSSDPSERIMLERLYGKVVWEPLLRNPRLTAPEVARIARMGALPRPLLEAICNNGGWLQIPEVRRALLSNPRLGTDQILRVLRLMPKHELKLATAQTAYPMAVRDAAKRLLK